MDSPLFASPKHPIVIKDIDSVVQHLTDSDADCDMTPATNVNTFILSNSWKTVADGYTITSWAMDQICRAICPGLNRVIDSMAQDVSERGRALDLYNQLVKSRFDSKLNGRQVFVDNKSKTVEGVVGNTYKQLLHSNLFEMLVQSADDGSFDKAVIVGRWLTASFRCKPFSAGWTRGWYISSNDVGAASIKVRATLQKSGVGTVIVPAAASGTVRHAGRTVQSKLTNAFVRASDGLPDPVEFQSQVEKRAKLLVPSSERGGDRPSEIVVQIANQLIEAGIPPSVAKRAVKSVALKGYSKEAVASTIGMLLPKDWETRDQMLVVRALCKQASKLSVIGSERVLTAAYRLLAGEIIFN